MMTECTPIMLDNATRRGLFGRAKKPSTSRHKGAAGGTNQFWRDHEQSADQQQNYGKNLPPINEPLLPSQLALRDYL